MSWVKDTLTSSIGQKVIMSLTGLGLIIFLLVHLAGNISLLFEEGETFNRYAHFMKHNTLIKISEYGLFGMFIIHIIQGIMVSKKNSGARSQKYAVPHKNEKVNWTSKYMIHFGIIILVFLLLHLWDFFSFKYFRELDIPNALVTYDGVEMHNLFGKVIDVYTKSPVHWIIYPIAMLVLGFHLNHGFQSAFQTLGWNHKKYTPIIKGAGTVYAVVIPLVLAVIPILIKLGITI